ncbi:acyl--CoA ligase [Altererythrobacter sp. SALINAS58]|uniref:class I adenylate-forming enzyme family protein n=1 Tax=Alteripontixanthobacter muriae TaxID=2705546 RepID=UPI00157573AB|nr:class I adenylate-forming enzyme family protein [Alteripontixanthobacter muriae]NTZ44105.1 acyl--CoA ligase [Alteripontixanthobacter muriae]
MTQQATKGHITAPASSEWTRPDGWPARSRGECRTLLTAPDARFAMETIPIRGVPTRVWKNAPPSLRQVAEIGRSHGDRTFIVYDDERVAYDAWFRAVAVLAADLQGRGIGKGDRVALAMRNLPEWPVAFFAVTSVGAICVPLNGWWTGPELAYGLTDSGAKLLICDAERLERLTPHLAGCPELETIVAARVPADANTETVRLEEIIGNPGGYADLPENDLPPAEIAPEDDATIFYTSGTTGNPKGALGTHRNLCTNIMSTGFNGAMTVLRRGDPLPAPQPKTNLTVIPLFHVTACSAGLMGNIAAGNTMVFMHKWDPVEAFRIIERERVSVTGGVPTIAWQMLEHPERSNYDLSSLETIAYGGAPAAPELVRRIADTFGALPGNGWGMTETMATVTGHSAEDYRDRPASCGPPVAVSDLKITDPVSGMELPPGEIGELWARGPQVVKGYWNRPQATAETFVDGWVRTGDLAWLDEDGLCYIADRAKDMIIRGGENIYSSEIENVLYDHPSVTDAALIGLPDRVLGEEPAAIVHLASGQHASEAELQEWVAARLAKFKVPVRIVFSPTTLPRNANGKILKKDLAALF